MPVVSTPVGAIPEVVRDESQRIAGRTGPEVACAYSAAIQRLIDDRTLTRCMGEAALIDHGSYFDLSVYVETLAGLGVAQWAAMYPIESFADARRLRVTPMNCGSWRGVSAPGDGGCPLRDSGGRLWARWCFNTPAFSASPRALTSISLPLSIAARKEGPRPCHRRDLRTVDLPREHFDVVYSSFVLEHIEGAERRSTTS